MQKATELHFLIHPGFCADPDMYGDIDSDALWQEEKARKEKECAHLLEAYVQSARELTRTGLMAVFLHRTRDEVRKDTKRGKAYITLIQQLSEILGPRVAVMEDNWQIFDDLYSSTAETMQALRDIFSEGGFQWDQDVTTVAYGEVLDCCVVDGAQSLNIAGGFTAPTLIRPEVTERRGNDADITRIIKNIQEVGEHPRTAFKD